MASLTFDRASKVYPDGARAVSDISLEIADGEFMVLVGPSGCGKSTALRMLGGLEEITDGSICIDRLVVNALTPRERDLAMIFQNYALYPHMTVAENIAFPLKLRGRPREFIDTQVRDAARMLGIESLLGRKPRSLSGGQRQRVAIGRAIVRQPRAFLMDEPLSNLDAKLRVQMRTEVAKLQRQLGVTTLYVTHDQVEAMTMGDRVAVMRAGEIEQVGRPAELYAKPRNRFVAGFIGNPAMNLLDGVIERSDGAVSVTVGERTISLLNRGSAFGRHERRSVIVGIRPESLEDVALLPGVPKERTLRARVELIEQLGADLLVHLRIPGAQTGELGLVGRFTSGSRVSPGMAIDVAVDTDSIHLFERESGLAL